jgi:hypothetical protein
MHLGLVGIFSAHWSADIHEEWIRNLLQKRPDLTREQLEHIRNLMDQALPNELVTGYEHLIHAVPLPDADDRHVLAAALQCGASVIVTFNLADFPDHILRPLNMQVQHPDVFVLALVETAPAQVIEAARNHRTSLHNPPQTIGAYLAALDAQGLSKTALALRQLIANGDMGSI